MADIDPDRAVALALEALDAAGVPRDHVVLAVTADHEADGGTPYQTHVGATEDRGLATLLSLVTKDLYREAREQGMFLADSDSCPRCSSLRFGPRHKPRGPGRIRVVLECVTCGFSKPMTPADE